MPNCLADNITGHSCDPYVFLRDIRLYLFYIANILVKHVPVGLPGSTVSRARSSPVPEVVASGE